MAAHDAGTVSLAEIRAKGLTLDVYEALAVVQAVCRDILDSDNPIPPARLDLDRIFIADDGTVTATAAAGQDEASGIQAIGRLLSQLLPSVDFLLLRPRVVAKATSTPPGYSTLDEFSRALGTYQRPGGTETLKELYERWKKRSNAAPAVDVGGAQDQSKPSQSSRNAVRIAIALLFVVGVGAGTYWLWTHRARFMGPARTASAAPASDASSGGGADPAAASAASTADGANPNHPATTPGSSARSSGTGAAPANGPRATPLRITSPSSGSGGVRSASSPGSTAAPGGSRSTAPGGAAATAGASTSVDRAAGANPAESAGSGVAATNTFETLSVYSNRNADVEPPTVIYPQRLVPVSGATVPDRPTIEIVVNESGSVDSVKASAAPRTLGESVVITSALSAAKSWRFRPALREGRPVKYRLLVTFSDR